MTVRIEFDAATAWIYPEPGKKSEMRRRITACGDAYPLWVKRRDAWGTSLPVANRVADQLDARRINVLVENTDQATLDLTATTPANVPAERRTLW